ncbi:serpin peptidase inhibitor, clade F (alpha-2 antiplasmin, pigment epithelium derived factor), member 2b [Gouania willdenowi]|uniref:serpin peptidase inhibitor, clade F (alpha-2 antiplasmin, pigment epithelium derived factor), member 2b n=1 Tax=Gouania willdenowi TaxID=441366 RepID=UPI001055BC1B|nr:alpha-2-antiplasmin [Gouania willdenowi]
MDLCLTLLLICLCSQGTTNAEVAENESIPLVPLIPLLPSQPIEEGESNTTAESEPADTAAPATQSTATADGPNGTSSNEEEEGCLSVSRRPQSREPIAAAIQKLGVQLLQNLEPTPEQQNVIISPLSISLALSQLALGAVNETEELLMHHLHANTLPCYHQSLHNILEQLTNNDLQIATRIFLRPGFKPKEGFVTESRQLYDSEPAVLESLEQINEWVENATKGQMSDFLSALPPNLLLLLINAVHFKGEWRARFDPRFTSRGVFYLDDKHMVDVDVMENAKHPLRLFIDNELEAQVASFPFQKAVSLLVVMPLSGQVNVSALSAKLNISRLNNNLPKERVVQVKVPKFKLEYAQELQEVFTKLGLGKMFSSPNLAEMADGPLLVSSVMHKSSMEINEEGAEAAAATTVVISRASSPVFHLTQPFFFALMDDMTQIPIFMGVINNPNPDAPVLQRDLGDKEKMGFPIDKNQQGSFGSPPK